MNYPVFDIGSEWYLPLIMVWWKLQMNIQCHLPRNSLSNDLSNYIFIFFTYHVIRTIIMSVRLPMKQAKHTTHPHPPSKGFTGPSFNPTLEGVSSAKTAWLLVLLFLVHLSMLWKVRNNILRALHINSTQLEKEALRCSPWWAFKEQYFDKATLSYKK